MHQIIILDRDLQFAKSLENYINSLFPKIEVKSMNNLRKIYNTLALENTNLLVLIYNIDDFSDWLPLWQTNIIHLRNNRYVEEYFPSLAEQTNTSKLEYSIYKYDLAKIQKELGNILEPTISNGNKVFCPTKVNDVLASKNYNSGKTSASQEFSATPNEVKLCLSDLDFKHWGFRLKHHIQSELSKGRIKLLVPLLSQAEFLELFPALSPEPKTVTYKNSYLSNLSNLTSLSSPRSTNSVSNPSNLNTPNRLSTINPAESSLNVARIFPANNLESLSQNFKQSKTSFNIASYISFSPYLSTYILAPAIESNFLSTMSPLAFRKILLALINHLTNSQEYDLLIIGRFRELSFLQLFTDLCSELVLLQKDDKENSLISSLSFTKKLKDSLPSNALVYEHTLPAPVVHLRSLVAV